MGWLRQILRKLPAANRLARLHDLVGSEIRQLRWSQERLRADLRGLEWELASQRARTELLGGRLDGSLPGMPPLPAITHCRLNLADGCRLSVFVPAPAEDPISQVLAQGVLPAIVPESLQDRYLRPGKVVLDLGAHLGVWTLLAAARGCTVVAVEAHPDNVSLLRASVAANNLASVHVVWAAINDRPGTVRLLWSGPYGFVAPGDQGEGGVDVPSRTVDDILAGLNIAHVDLVKMDVEGSEVRAVRGMARLLSGPDAPAIFYESNGHCLHKFGNTCCDLKRLFAQHGYTSYREVGHQSFRPVDPEDVQPQVCIDYLATKTPPAEWRGWQVAAAQEPAELRAEVLGLCGTGSQPQRDHLDRELLRGPAWLRADKSIQAARQHGETSAGRSAA